jgi:hypothetical protein
VFFIEAHAAKQPNGFGKVAREVGIASPLGAAAVLVKAVD